MKAKTTHVLFFIAAFLFLFIIDNSDALYVRLNEGDLKCYIEEVPKDTLILTKWKASVENEQMGVRYQHPVKKVIGFVLTVKDPNGDVVMSKTVGTDGRTAFSSHVGGEFTICFVTNTSRWFGSAARIKMEIDIETGASAFDYAEIAQAEDLNDIEIEIRRLNDEAFELMKEQSYLKAREIEARNTSENVNSKVMWWSLAETILLVCSGVWQIRHLKNFFKQKKLV